MNERTAIVWCVDNNEKYNLMTLHSIFCAAEYNKNSDFFVMTLRNNKYSLLYKMFSKLEIIYVDTQYNQYFKSLKSYISDNIISNFAYCRFLILYNDVFKQYDKILYLDCDCFVKKQFDDIFNIQSLNAKIMLVPETTTYNYNLKLLKKFCIQNNFVYNQKYYGNSGVMLFIMKNINAFDYENIINITQVKFPSYDQGIINYYFQNKIQFIDPIFNANIETCQNKSILQNCVIRHYSGNEKYNILINNKKRNATLQNVINKLQNKTDKLILLNDQ